MPSPATTSLTARPPNASEPSKPETPTRPEKTSDTTNNASSLGPYTNTWLLQSRTRLDAAFERVWAAYTAEYNREFKTRASTEEIRGRVMAGHNIHGEEDVLLPRPTVEHRLTRRKRKVGG